MKEMNPVEHFNPAEHVAVASPESPTVGLPERLPRSNAPPAAEAPQPAGQQALERRIAQLTAELELANQELAAFTYSVSHDLRAPLRSIDGFSQALLDDCNGTLPEAGRQHLQRIRGASQRMRQLIDNLLNLSRVSRAELQRKPLDLAIMAQMAAAGFRQAAPQRQVNFSTVTHLPATGDATLIRMALENLLDNAWKFTRNTADARVELGVSESAGGRAFFVRDNGAGFDMAYVGKLFGAFQRLHPLTEFEGTGVGLATVQRIIHRHGGRVWAEGVVNRGATFYFTLPD